MTAIDGWGADGGIDHLPGGGGDGPCSGPQEQGDGSEDNEAGREQQSGRLGLRRAFGNDGDAEIGIGHHGEIIERGDAGKTENGGKCCAEGGIAGVFADSAEGGKSRVICMALGE